MLILLFCFIAGLSCYFAIITNNYFPLIACYFSIISGLPRTACYFCYFAILLFSIISGLPWTACYFCYFAILLFSIISGLPWTACYFCYFPSLLVYSWTACYFCYFTILLFSHHYWFTPGQHAIFAILLFFTIIPIVLTALHVS